MAAVLDYTGVDDALIWAFKKLEFCCKRVGSCCNANHPRPFTKAECDSEPIYDCGGAVAAVDFKSIYESAFHLIADLKRGKQKFEELDDRFKKALEVLDKFMTNKSVHEKSIQVLKNGDKITETAVTTVLAEHLLSKLAPGKSYTIDKKCRGKDKHDCCLCGCGAKIKYGDTGIGHEEKWHGFIDIMFSSHEGLLSGTESSNEEIEEPDIVASNEGFVSGNVSLTHREPVPETAVVTEPVAKRSKKECDGSPEGKCPVEVKIDLDDSIDTEDQIIAQGIVFSLLQRQRHPDFKIFLIPTIVISREHILIIMYDAENDVLLRSQSICLFMTRESLLLSTRCIVLLWLILHYRIFCSGLKKKDLRSGFENLTKVKSGFIEKLTPESTKLYSCKLKSCVGSFPRVIKKGNIEDSCTVLIYEKSDKFWSQSDSD